MSKGERRRARKRRRLTAWARMRMGNFCWYSLGGLPLGGVVMDKRAWKETIQWQTAEAEVVQ